jgi:iron(III) transport system substrate-binding protein
MTGGKGVVIMITRLIYGTLLLGVLAILAAAPARSETLKELKAAAQKEGGVVAIHIAHSATPPFRKALPDLEKTVGLKVQLLTGSSSTMATKIVSEQRVGKYTADLWFGGPSSISNVFVPAKAIQDLRPLLTVPEVVDPTVWFGDDLPWASDWSLAFAADENHGLIVYNPKLVNPDEFTSYWDILNPKWKGKIAMRDPRENGVQSPRTFFYTQLGKAFYTRLFDEMKPVIAPDARTASEWVARGKYAFCIMGCNRAAESAEAQGLPVKASFPKILKEGYPVDMGGNGITAMSNPPHPAATKYFVNWFLSREGQIFYQKMTGNFSLRNDIPRDGVEPGNFIQADSKQYHWYGWKYPEARDESQVWLREMMRERGFQ